jgi:hypothetical protein
MLREQVFSDINRYSNGINPEYAAQIAEHIEKEGFIDLDDPNAPKRKIPRTDAQLRELEGIERAKAEKKAQAEHQAALANLANGTAVLRQKSERTKLIKKVTKKATKTYVEPKRKPHNRVNHNKSRFDRKAALDRRLNIMSILKNGGRVEYKHQGDCEGGYTEYQTQYTDIRWLARTKQMSIIRIQRIKDSKSYFTLDRFSRHHMSESISGRLSLEDNHTLLAVISSKEVLLASDINTTTKIAARSIAVLARKYGFDIYTVFNGRTTEGWVLLDEAEADVMTASVESDAEEKRESEISDLGDMLDALDYLRVRKEVAARMPTSTPDEILEAAYREFKRVAKDAGSTISEVLAVKDGQ